MHGFQRAPGLAPLGLGFGDGGPVQVVGGQDERQGERQLGDPPLPRVPGANVHLRELPGDLQPEGRLGLIIPGHRAQHVPPGERRLRPPRRNVTSRRRIGSLSDLGDIQARDRRWSDAKRLGEGDSGLDLLRPGVLQPTLSAGELDLGGQGGRPGVLAGAHPQSQLGRTVAADFQQALGERDLLFEKRPIDRRLADRHAYGPDRLAIIVEGLQRGQVRRGDTTGATGPHIQGDVAGEAEQPGRGPPGVLGILRGQVQRGVPQNPCRPGRRFGGTVGGRRLGDRRRAVDRRRKQRRLGPGERRGRLQPASVEFGREALRRDGGRLIVDASAEQTASQRHGQARTTGKTRDRHARLDHPPRVANRPVIG